MEHDSPPDGIAARARELAEEAAARYEQYDGGQRPAVMDSIAADTVADISSHFGHHSAKLIRDWTRSVLGVHAIKRLFDIGMGVAEFRVPTMTGAIVEVPASAGVQVKALTAVVAVGVPRQLGIVDQGDGELPGVFALGELDLDEARRVAHGERYMPAPAAPPLPPVTGDVPPPMAERVAAGEFELVEVDETAADPRGQPDADDAPPEPLPPAPPTMEQLILAKRRAQRARSRNGHGNGQGGVDAARD